MLFSIINQCASCSLPLSRGGSIQEFCMWMKVWQTHMIIYSATTACSHKNHWDASLSTDYTVHFHSICPLGEHGQAHTFSMWLLCRQTLSQNFPYIIDQMQWVLQNQQHRIWINFSTHIYVNQILSNTTCGHGKYCCLWHTTCFPHNLAMIYLKKEMNTVINISHSHVVSISFLWKPNQSDLCCLVVEGRVTMPTNFTYPTE